MRARPWRFFGVGAVALLSFLLVGPSSGLAITLPPANDINSAIDGDFLVYSLPLIGINVKSTPGAIKDGVVIYTGSDGTGVTTNFAEMDDAYPSVTGACPPNCFFSTTTTADPGGAGQFTGDAAGSWDMTLASLLTFLGGKSPLFFFNQNESNPSTPDPTSVGDCGMVSAQDLCAYGMLTLVDSTDSANNLVLEFERPTHLTSDGFLGTNGSASLPSEYVLAKGDVCLDAAGNQQACDGSQAIGPVNHNLGANDAAYIILSPALNAALAACQANGIGGTGCPWDSLSIRIDLDGLSNGFEQLFMLTADQVTVPQPGSLMLVGAGLIGVGVLAWRRRHRA